ncbi:hypothetical protein M885DRAFT_576622 [Pelagophyceae sp. CCMP2097]|nr:hypothetical protein M885DRAFT_576622 [Pelagophyceae sp. CCMP2097]
MAKSGERTDEEKHHLAAQILKLEAALVVKREERKMLVGQSRRLANELRAAKRRGEDAVNDEQTARARIQEMELENTSAEQSLVQKKAKEAEALVASDMSRLELRRLREALGQRADVVFTLENRKQQLSLSMAERQREIGVHTAVQAAQLRHANEDRHQAKMELGKRKHHAHTLAAKYDVLVKSSKLRVGDEEPQSQAFYLIQAAQQRAELQRAGDDLDSAIRKREREMRALEATLAHVNARNTTYRDSFKKAAPQSADADDLAQLEEQEKLAKDALFRRKKALQRLATDHEEDARRLAQVDEQCLRLRERNGHLREAEAQMALELQAHDAALAQLGDRVAQLAQLHREALGTSAETVQERLFAAEAAEESNASVLATLHELSRAYPEIDDSLAGILAGLRPANA